MLECLTLIILIYLPEYKESKFHKVLKKKARISIFVENLNKDLKYRARPCQTMIILSSAERDESCLLRFVVNPMDLRNYCWVTSSRVNYGKYRKLGESRFPEKFLVEGYLFLGVNFLSLTGTRVGRRESIDSFYFRKTT